MNKIQLIIGGARSGKSSLAEQYAKASNLPVTYIATAQAFDVEMTQRISLHQADRSQHWALIESPLLLAQAIESAMASSSNGQGICILIDCLTLWLSNSLCKPSDTLADDCLQPSTHTDTQQETYAVNLDYWQQEKTQLLALLTRISQQACNDNGNSDVGRVEIILVSNEVGHGIVPMGELSRQFVDQAGWLHQAIASIADNVEFVMAGLPLTLKSAEKTNNKVQL
ncbi:MAG: bifunctional adenosylcobinamide kinase/adenosylcobinamide-phosphate guanylyltransferase [Cognaticolwellia sp.]